MLPTRKSVRSLCVLEFTKYLCSKVIGFLYVDFFVSFAGYSASQRHHNGFDQHVPVCFRHEYVELYVSFMLGGSVEAQFNSFCEGFLKVCGGRVLVSCMTIKL